LKVMSSSGQQTDEEMMQRKCVVAEFLTKAGLSGHSIELLRCTNEEQRGLKRTTNARRLGLLCDAILCNACFDDSPSVEYMRVGSMLERAVEIWREAEAEDLDEVCMAQALSNLCFFHSQMGAKDAAVRAGEQSLELFTRLRHPRLAQAQQHLAHVYQAAQEHQQALDLYKQSIATFERTGTAKFDTEHACTLQSIATTVLSTRRQELVPVCLAYLRAAVVSCEEITGQDHSEAQYYRTHLSSLLAAVGYSEEAATVEDGGEVVLSEEDRILMRNFMV